MKHRGKNCRGVENAAALLRKAERNRLANEAIHDQTRQRQFERSFLSRDMPDSLAARVEASDGGKMMRAIVRHVDAEYNQKRREMLMNIAAAKLPRRSAWLRALLWAIYRNGSNRRKTMAELGISKYQYWRGVKFLLNFYSVQ